MTNRHMKRCSTLLISQKMQIKTTMTYPSHLSEWLSPKRPQEVLLRMWRKGNTPIHCWWKCKLVQPLWKTLWGFLKKLKIELPYDPVILSLVNCPSASILPQTGELCTKGEGNQYLFRDLSQVFYTGTIRSRLYHLKSRKVK